MFLNKKLPIRNFSNSSGSSHPRKRNLLIVFIPLLSLFSFQSKEEANTPDCDVITFVTRQEAKKKRKLNHDNVAPPSHSSYFFYSCIHTHQNNPPPQNKETHKHTGFIVVLHHWNSNEIFEFFFDSVCVCVCLNKSIRF